MADYPTLPLMTDAFMADTQHLNLEEIGAYLKLIMIAWRSPDCALPDDPKRLAIMLGVGKKKFESLWSVVGPFWQSADGKLTQKRLLKVRATVAHKVEQKRAAGKASASAKTRKTHETASTDVATERPTGGQRRGQQPKPNTKEEKTNPPPPSSRESVPPRKPPSAEPLPDPLDIPEFLDRRRKPEAAQLDLATDPPTKPDKARGSRLPDDWQPGPDARSFAHSQGLTDAEIDSVAERFRDHWHGKSGAAARKASWLATWRNWVRGDIDRRRVGAGAGRGKPAAGSRAGGDGTEDRSFAASLARAAQRQAAGSAPKRGSG